MKLDLPILNALSLEMSCFINALTALLSSLLRKADSFSMFVIMLFGMSKPYLVFELK